MSSKIPVQIENRQTERTKLKGTVCPADNMKKEVQKFEFKETTMPPNFNFATKTENGVLKPQNNVPRKKQTAKVYKGPTARLEAELRDQNRLLEALNVDLQKSLSESKEKVAQLEQQYTELQGENSESQRQLETYRSLLVACEIDPISGERIAEIAEKQRTDVVNMSAELTSELLKFSEQCMEHRKQLEQQQQNMKALREAREQQAKEREAFLLEVQEMEKALEKAEQLLLEEL
ncbi:hypothetical protein MATL_G00208120 [Megalops atlanticus]|uniref:Small kinetochore-associated protein n=1 Tax=Megalops atlanticus TaxID=7932 RepID=A0A9D3PL67_MEGAT|nr:hypothetical protein MATL_G00208120 [Megalops atlanticus]